MAVGNKLEKCLCVGNAVRDGTGVKGYFYVYGVKSVLSFRRTYRFSVQQRDRREIDFVYHKMYEQTTLGYYC